MAGIRFSIAGMKELEAQLHKLSAATGRAALQRAGVKALQPTLALARQLAPKDTGELEKSLAVGVKATNADVGMAAYSSTKKGGGSDSEALKAMRDARREMRGQRGKYAVDIFMGPQAGRSKDDVIKGYVQEFGSFHVSPHPFLRPAFDQDKDALISRLGMEMMAEVTKSVDRAAARAAAKAAKG